MIKIGLVGEAPNDVDSIRYLLAPAFKGIAQFVQMQRNIRGTELYRDDFIKRLQIEVADKRCDVVVFIYDADGVRNEEKQLRKRIACYHKHSVALDVSHALLLNVYELEALLLADLEPFNKKYKVDAKYNGDTAMQAKPSEWLRERTKHPNRFEKSHCPDLFKQLSLTAVRKRCDYFETFYKRLEELVGQ